MKRGFLAAAAVSTFAIGAAFVACSSDDSPSPSHPADAGTSDVTVTSDAGTDTLTCAPFDAGPIDDATAALGLSLIVEHKCQTCHTSQLSGNALGVPAPTDDGGVAYPPNLTSDPATGLGCWTTAQIENAILHGYDNNGVYLCPPMPRFGEEDGGLTTDQAAAVAAYLQSLPAVSNPNVPGTYCPLPSDAGADTEVAPDANVPDSSGDSTLVDSTAPDTSPDGAADGSADVATDVGPDAGDETIDAASTGDTGPDLGVSDVGDETAIDASSDTDDGAATLDAGTDETGDDAGADEAGDETGDDAGGLASETSSSG